MVTRQLGSRQEMDRQFHHSQPCMKRNKQTNKPPSRNDTLPFDSRTAAFYSKRSFLLLLICLLFFYVLFKLLRGVSAFISQKHFQAGLDPFIQKGIPVKNKG